MEVTVEIKNHQLESFYDAINDYSKFIKVKEVLKSNYQDMSNCKWSEVKLIVDDDAIELLFGLGISFSTKVMIKRNY